jgi:hypothetical protein
MARVRVGRWREVRLRGRSSLPPWTVFLLAPVLLDGCLSSRTPPESIGTSRLQKNPLAGCSLCHVDVEDEFVKTAHFTHKVGCRTCHGPSEGHLADENNEVKPDEIFARADVDRLCADCHQCERPAPAHAAGAQVPEHKVCTDCHGSHTLVRGDL